MSEVVIQHTVERVTSWRRTALALGFTSIMSVAALGVQIAEGLGFHPLEVAKERICEWSDDPRIDNRVCEGAPDGVPLSMGSFSLEYLKDVGEINRQLKVYEERDRVVDETHGMIEVEFKTMVVSPPARFTVHGDYVTADMPLNPSQTHFETLMPESDPDGKANGLSCATPKEDPNYRGCMDFSTMTGFWQGTPMLGADNHQNLVRGMMRMLDMFWRDMRCSFEKVFAPAFTDILGLDTPLTANDALAVFLRANAREVGWWLKGIAPQAMLVPVDSSSPYDFGPGITSTYQREKGKYDYIPPLQIDDNWCVDGTRFKNTIGTGVLERIAFMGAPIVPDGYDPNTGETGSNDPRFRAPADMPR